MRTSSRRCRVWAAIRSRATPASAALVAWPARRECPLTRSPDRPAARARSLTMLETAVPEIGCREGRRPRRLVNTGPAVVPRTASQASRGGDRVRQRMLAVGDVDDWPRASGSVLERRRCSKRPSGLGSRSARVSAASSERRIAPAKPSRMTAVSRRPAVVLRSMAVMICRRVGDAQRPGGSARRGSEEAAQSATYLSDHLVVDRVGQSVAAVLVPDGRARGVDGGQGGGPVGAVGEVGAHSGRLGRELGDPAVVAPAVPLAPGEGVHRPGGLGVGGVQGGGDPCRVIGGEVVPGACGGESTGRGHGCDGRQAMVIGAPYRGGGPRAVERARPEKAANMWRPGAGTGYESASGAGRVRPGRIAAAPGNDRRRSHL